MLDSREPPHGSHPRRGHAVSDVDLEKVWAQIVSLKPQVKLNSSCNQDIRMFNSGDKAAPKGLLLYGPSGTGKTEIARRIADSTNSHFMGAEAGLGHEIRQRRPERPIGQEDLGGGSFPRALHYLRRRRVRPAHIRTESQVGRKPMPPSKWRPCLEFLASWDAAWSRRARVWVVGATNHRERLDEAIVGRFGAAVEIGMPEPAQRIEILRLEMRKLERDVEIPDFVGGMTTGLAGRNLSYVAKDVCSMAAERKSDITPEIWTEVIRRYLKDGNVTVDDGARWDSLVVSQDTLDKLQTLCESLRHMEVLRKQGFEPSRGALLYGPPGTGKTQIARTIANESGLPFIAAKLSDIKAGWLGQSGQKVKELFERARGKAPCILFIDEIDAGAVERTSPKADQLTNEIVAAGAGASWKGSKTTTVRCSCWERRTIRNSLTKRSNLDSLT